MALYFCYNEEEPTEGLFLGTAKDDDCDQLSQLIQREFEVTVLNAYDFKNCEVQEGYVFHVADNSYLELIEFDIYCIPAIPEINFFED